MAASVTLVVREADHLAEGILALTLVHPDGAELESWAPGAHVDVTLSSGAVRSYSLCGDPADRFAYRIAILREEKGRGASVALHLTRIGTAFPVAGPRNAFPLVDAAHRILIAGGIGITPLLPMLRQLSAGNASFEAYYLGRSRRSMAFLAEVEACTMTQGTPAIIVGDEGRRLDIAAVLAAAPDGSRVYCCGPERLLVAAELAAASASCSHITLHLERFGRPTLAEAEPPRAGDAMTAAICDPDGPFEIRLQRAGVTLQVPADRSILEVARSVRRDLTFSCSSGYCGTCEVRVLGGVPCHRDEVLSDSEKAANGSMMICVGRSRTACLILDL